jgi:hypothetical protein
MATQTTIQSYEMIQPKLGALQEIVYNTICRSTQALTDKEIIELTGIPESTCRPRRVELAKNGHIVAVGTIVQSNGRKATIWRSNTTW